MVDELEIILDAPLRCSACRVLLLPAERTVANTSGKCEPCQNDSKVRERVRRNIVLLNKQGYLDE